MSETYKQTDPLPYDVMEAFMKDKIEGINAVNKRLEKIDENKPTPIADRLREEANKKMVEESGYIDERVHAKPIAKDSVDSKIDKLTDTVAQLAEIVKAMAVGPAQNKGENKQ